MPKSLPIFSSFSSGEISPLLSARADVESYKNGCAILTNMVSTSHGPARRRYGTEMIAWDEPETPAVDKIIDARTFGFTITKSFGTFAYITLDEGGNTWISVVAPDGLVLQNTVELVDNPRFEERETSWTDISTGEGTARFSTGQVVLTPGTGTAGIRQQVSGTVNGNDLKLRVDRLEGGTDITVNVGTTSGGSDIYTVTTKSKIIDVEFENTGTTSVWLEVIAPADAGASTIETVSMFDSTVTAPVDAPVKFSGPWGAADLPLMQADSPPEGNALYISSPYTPVQKLTYNPATVTWAFAAVSFTGAPTEWTTGNYPRAITFFQGRMWLGGTPNEKETFWASKSAVIENFTQGASADDGLEFTLSEAGAIEWVTGAKNLIIGTARGEHIVESAGGVIIPSDIQITQQSSYGSRSLQSEKIGQKVMYVSPDGRKVREIGYQWTDDGWLSRDITFASEHITDGNNIKQMAFAQNPDNLLWCVTDQGDLVCGTYEKTYNVIGWHRHTTEGTFIDVASIDINGTSIAGLVVKRNIDGEERFLFEIIDPAETFYVDAFKYFYADTAVVEVGGLEHLAGNTVGVLTDTGVHPNVPVDSTGTLRLQWEANTVIIGHNYQSHLRTLSPDMIGSEGSTHSLEKGWNRILVRILNSAIPLINDLRPADRSPDTPMNEPEPLCINDVEVTDLGYQSWNRIDVKQDLPLPLIVVGVFGEQTRSNL